MGRLLHLQQDIIGALTNWTDRDWQLNAREWKRNGCSMNAAELRAEFARLAGEGFKLIPCGPCEGFDPHTGCPGHEIEELTND